MKHETSKEITGAKNVHISQKHFFSGVEIAHHFWDIVPERALAGG